MLQRIEAAMGKTIARDSTIFLPDVVLEDYDEGPEEWDAEELAEEIAP